MQEQRVLEQEESFGGDGYVHYRDCGSACTRYTYIRTYQIEPFMCILLNVSHAKIKIKTLCYLTLLLTHLRLISKFARS